MKFRYRVQRYGTWEWLDLDFPLDTDGPEWVLNSYGVMSAVIPPTAGMLRAEDGRLVFEEWGTLIHVDRADSSIRDWTGIVVESGYANGRWNLTIWEWSGYLKGYPLDTQFKCVEEDPVHTLRRVWNQVQSRPRSNLGVSVLGSSPLRIGTNTSQLVSAARATLKQAKSDLDAFTKAQSSKSKNAMVITASGASVVAQARRQLSQAERTVRDLVIGGFGQELIDAAMEDVQTLRGLLEDALDVHDLDAGNAVLERKNAQQAKSAAEVLYELAQAEYDRLVELEKQDGGAYVVSPGGLSDAFKIATDLLSEGFEYTTRSVYSEGVPILEIQTHYPRAGRKRDDLVFEQGGGVGNVVSDFNNFTRGGEDYANAAIGVGVGEGKSALRESIELNTPRMRRVAVVEDQALLRRSVLLSAVRKELASRSGVPYVPEFEVVDCEQTPIGSWEIGDLITLTGEVPNLGRWSGLLRIVSWRRKGESRAIIRTVPAK